MHLCRARQFRLLLAASATVAQLPGKRWSQEHAQALPHRQAAATWRPLGLQHA